LRDSNSPSDYSSGECPDFSPTCSELTSDKIQELENMVTCCNICGFCGPKTADGYCKNKVTGPHMTMYGKRKRSMVLNPDVELPTPDFYKGVFTQYNENEGNSTQPSYKDEYGQVFVGRYDPNKSFVKGRTTADIEHAENQHIHHKDCKCVICTIGGIVLIDEDGNPTGNTASDPGGVGSSFELPYENSLFHLDAKRIYEGLDNYIETNGIGHNDSEVIDPELAERLLRKLGKRILYPKPSFDHGHRPCPKCNTDGHRRSGLTGESPVKIEDRELVKVDTEIPNTCECGICGKCENGIPISTVAQRNGTCNTCPNSWEKGDKIFWLKPDRASIFCSDRDCKGFIRKTISKVTSEALMPYSAFVKSSDYRMHTPYNPQIEILSDPAFYTSGGKLRKLKTNDGHEAIDTNDVNKNYSRIGNNGAGHHRRSAHNVQMHIVNDKIVFDVDHVPKDCPCQRYNDPFFTGVFDDEEVHIAYIKESLKHHPKLLTKHYGVDVKEVTFLAKDDEGVMRMHTTHVSDSDTPMSVPWRLKTMAGLPLWMQSETVVEILDTEYSPFGKPEWDYSKPHIGLPYVDPLLGPMVSRTDKKYLKKLKAKNSFESNEPLDGLASNNQRLNIFGPHGIVLPDWITYRFAFDNAEKLGYGKVSKTLPRNVQDVKDRLAIEVWNHEHSKLHQEPFKTEWCDECNAFYRHQEYFDATQVEGKIEPELNTIVMFNESSTTVTPSKMVFDENGDYVNRSPFYVGIVGSAKDKEMSFTPIGEVQRVLTKVITDLRNQHGKRLVITSGGAEYVDTYAVDIAESLGVKTLVYEADIQLDYRENRGDWDPVSRKYKNKRQIQMPRWKDGKYRHDLGRVEVGFRTRNLRIANKVQHIVVVAIQPGTGMCAPTEWQGPRQGLARTIRCIHCNGEHYTTAGCWTAIKAKALNGATVETIEIPDGGVETHTICFPSKWSGTCKACNTSWEKGIPIFWQRTEEGVPSITCSDRDCFVKQGGEPRMVV